MLSDYELHQLELNVGITPEGLRRDTDILIREIDDELLKLDGVDQSYKNEVFIARCEKAILETYRVPYTKLDSSLAAGVLKERRQRRI